MTKRSFYWRNGAMIIACLVVTTMFVACDETNGDGGDGNGGGKIDTKLVGVWTSTWNNTYIYSFSKDGSCYYYSRMSGSSYASSVNGKYTTSNGRVYFTELVSDLGEKMKDQNMKYSFGTDKDGEYVEMAHIEFVPVTSSNVPSGNIMGKFWRSKN